MWYIFGGVASLKGDSCIPRMVCPSLVPTKTQLSPVAPSSCQHATAATPMLVTTSTSRLNQVRVADAPHMIGYFGLAYPCMLRFFLVEWEDKIIFVDPMATKLENASCCWVQRAWQSNKDFLVTYCSHSSPQLQHSFMPMKPDFCSQEWNFVHLWTEPTPQGLREELSFCQKSYPHYNIVIAALSETRIAD